MVERRRGGQLLVDQLAINGASLVFGVPGESYLAVLDALHDKPPLRFITCRQEGGATMMAEAFAKLTGQPGIAMVTRGPGATNASAGIHVAFQDSTPLILFIGQIARDTVERDAFQEIDYRRMYGPMAKWVAEIDDAARIPEFIHRAFVTAMSGRPGPVVLALPEDMLRDEVEVEDGVKAEPVHAHPSPADMAWVAERLNAAERPLVILGGSGWDEAGCQAMQAFARAHELPVAVGFRRHDLMDNDDPCYAGDIGIAANPKLLARLEESDFWFVVGSRLGEMTSNSYTRFGLPRPRKPMVHVLNGPEELGRIYQPDRMILSHLPAFAKALHELRIERKWPKWRAALRADYEAHIQPPRIPGDVQMGEIMTHLNAELPRDAILTNGAGNYTAWPNRYYRYGPLRTLLAPTSGSMGYGLPAAVAAGLVHPDRKVICFAGDGCLMMSVQEIATAVQYGSKVIILVVNNGMLGTIRMHQERDYPDRISGTPLVNPDFAALARSMGAFGETVSRTTDFEAAFEAAQAFDGPALIDLQVDPQALTPETTLDAWRDRALAIKSR